MKQELIRAAKRLASGNDFETVLLAKLEETNELILAAPVNDRDPLVGLLCQYHALREFGEFVAAIANEKDG